MTKKNGDIYREVGQGSPVWGNSMLAQAKGLKEPVMGRGEDKPGDTSERRWEWLSRGPGAEARVTGEQLRNSDFVLREMGSHCRV